jgi:hypothetical protein
MSDWVYLALGLGIIVALINIPLFLWSRRGSQETHADLRALQLESARLTLQSRRESRRDMAELKAWLKSAGIRLDQIFERVGDR